MSDLAAAPSAALPRPLPRTNRLMTAAVMITAVTVYVGIANRVLSQGYVRLDIAALQSGSVWKSGGWLSELVLTLIGVFPIQALRQSMLSLFAAAATGVLLGILFHRLRTTGWSVLGAMLMIVALGSNLLVLRAVTGTSLSLPVYLAIAALVPTALRVESVGDVQSSMSLGLTMPLLLLAGPATTPLILPIAIVAALADPDGRKDLRAFLAMVLVAVLPSLIVALGIIGFALQANVDIAALLLPYFAAYRPGGEFSATELVLLMAYAPVLVAPIAWCVLNRASNARWSALVVVLLPVYLVAGGIVFYWNLPPWAPPLALLSAFASWLTVARLTASMRAAAAILSLAASALSWVLPPLWNDPTWQSALSSLLSR